MVQEEHFIQSSDGRIYSTRVLSDEIFLRYLKFFEKIIVFARVSKVDTICNYDNLKEITLKEVEFLGISEFRGPKGMLKNSFEIISKFREACKLGDIIFLRTPSMLTLFIYRFMPKNKIIGIEFMMGAQYFIESETFFARITNRVINREAQKLALRANGALYVTKRSLQTDYPPNAKAADKKESNYFTVGVSDVVLNSSSFYKRNELVKQREVYTIVSVGFMDSYRKGQHILIQSISILKTKGYNIKLKLIGDGEKRIEFEKLASKLDVEEEVEFLGKISDPSIMNQELISSDIFVLPTKMEGLPRVIIEALAVGMPVIASNVNGNCELVQDEFLVDDFDPESYSSKMELLINSINLYNKISSENFINAQNFLPEQLDKKRNNFFQKLANLATDNIK